MSAQTDDVKSIFGRAIEIQAPEERAAFLDRACGDNATVRAEVEGLIQALEKAGPFMLKPASDPDHTTAQPAIATPGTLIAGRYKLLEEIAEGGMGTVWVAEQFEPVRRRVAIKLIKPGMDSKQVLSRFEAERQALALMDHPNIARVLDGGMTDQGRPFFAMEYVKGVPITEYCDQSRLSVAERLKLFVQVCQAVQHAHQKGIIHRDLKPSNILVCLYDGQPVPKVIDFGLAKAMHQPLTERTVYTAHGILVGTPLYMSPEQAEFNNLDIDTRTDVYSLGVILYELLTGATPLDRAQFRDAAWQEIVRLIKEEEPTKPSTKLSGSGSLPTIAAQRDLEPAQLSRLLRGDLDWIVMKSLEKERSRRYETANGLARDIERFLRDDPVEARPPSAGYRFGKFARRNRAALITASLVSGAMVVGTAVSIWQAVRATRAEQVAEAARVDEGVQRKLAESQRNEAMVARAAEAEQRRVAESEQAEAEKQRTVAEANFQKARTAVDEYFTLVSESKLLDLPGAQPLRKDLLESAERFYRESSASRAADPSVLADAAAANLRLAMIYLAVNRVDDAIEAIRNGLDSIDRLRREHGDATEHLQRLAGFWRGLRWTQGTLAIPDPLAALTAMTRLEKTWTDLAEKYNTVPAFRSDLVAVRAILGSMLTQYGRAADGEAWFRKAFATLEPLMHEFPNEPRYRADMLAGSGGFANTLQKNGHPEDVRPTLLRAIGIGEQLLVEYPNHPIYRSDLADVHLELARMLWSDAATAGEANEHFRKAALITESLVRDFPGVRGYADTLQRAAHFWFIETDKAGDPRAIEAAAREFVRIETLMMGQNYEDLIPRARIAIALCRIAGLLEKDEARAEQAEGYRRRGLAVLEEYLEVTAGNDPNLLNTFAWTLVTSMQVDPALAKLAVASAERALEASPESGWIANTLGVAYYRNGQWKEATETLLKARKLGGSHLCDDGYFLAMAYEKLGDHEAALRWFRAAEAWTVQFGEYRNYYGEAAELLGVPMKIIKVKPTTPDDERELVRVILEADEGEARWVHIWLAEKAIARGDLQAASQAFDAVIAASPEEAHAYYLQALLKLMQDDSAGYRDVCRKMNERFALSGDKDAQYWFLWTSGLASGALDNYDAAIEQAAELASDSPDEAKHHSCLGMLLYRAGRFGEAVAPLVKADTLLANSSQTTTTIYPRLLLAMAHHRQGNADEARRWLAKAKESIRQESPGNSSWNRKATVELLQDEAKASMGESQ